MPIHHHDEIHEYSISNYILNADVIVNMPKPKSHRKAGVTISLKNFVGANTRKEFLPHHTKGSIKKGGDEFLPNHFLKNIQSALMDRKNINVANHKYKKAGVDDFLYKCCAHLYKSGYSEGSWYGNDTISRTIVDLNRIIKYADKVGIIKNTPQRRQIIIADMIISGEKEGPVTPSPKKVGIIAAGFDPVLFDETIATIMGFDPKKIPTIRQARSIPDSLVLTNNESSSLLVKSNYQGYNVTNLRDIKKNDILCFEPSSGWKNHIELER